MTKVIVVAFVITLVVMIGINTSFSAKPADLPASVHITIHSYTEGLIQRTCWQNGWQYVPLPEGGYALYVDCRTSLDGIFKNGFEA